MHFQRVIFFLPSACPTQLGLCLCLRRYQYTPKILCRTPRTLRKSHPPHSARVLHPAPRTHSKNISRYRKILHHPFLGHSKAPPLPHTTHSTFHNTSQSIPHYLPLVCFPRSFPMTLFRSFPKIFPRTVPVTPWTLPLAQDTPSRWDQ